MVMKKKRLAVIDRELCKNKKCGYQCMKTCPVNRSGEECIAIEEGGVYPVVNESLCIGCMLCQKKCEKMGYKAISVVNLPEKLEGDPVHRYGKNEFSLFRLPIPKKDFVVGLIGPNGIGKSTVLNMLSGNLRPNLGVFDGKASWDMIIGRFKGSELQSYLEILRDRRVSIGYKPQHVDLIPEMWKGKVRDILKRHDHEGRMGSVAKRLGMEAMMEREVSKLSGGELQLLAIAGAMMKKAAFYFFDEPSSYLDVRQRLMAAREIRKLAAEAYVMVVEHDLAVLDYLSDHVHLLYGSPGVFGVVSQPYGVRTGINTYLEGYIREENMRFRDKPIHFSRTAKSSEKVKNFLEYSAFGKGFREFSLKTEKGNLKEGEVIGILGPNGIGKTTMIKMLAGEVRPDSGEPIEGLKVSYKHQRLSLKEGEREMTVSDFLSREVGSKLFETEFKKMLNSLGITKNLEKVMGNLSGGELQAVLIVSSIGKEHDILLIDEPSAFLDVEQRLNVCKIIRSHVEEREVSAFVIDHDLQVIDAIADRVIVFEGEPGKKGSCGSPRTLKDGMNTFLRNLEVTFRRDPLTGRARANKPGSQKEREQMQKNAYYYE